LDGGLEAEPERWTVGVRAAVAKESSDLKRPIGSDDGDECVGDPPRRRQIIDRDFLDRANVEVGRAVLGEPARELLDGELELPEGEWILGVAVFVGGGVEGIRLRNVPRFSRPKRRRVLG